MVIEGFSAGGLYNAKGSATTTLCLSHDPDAAPARVSFYSPFGVLYGSEFEFLEIFGIVEMMKCIYL